MSCQRSDLRETLKYSQSWTPCLIFEHPTVKVRRRPCQPSLALSAPDFEEIPRSVVSGKRQMCKKDDDDDDDDDDDVKQT